MMIVLVLDTVFIQVVIKWYRKRFRYIIGRHNMGIENWVQYEVK